MKHDDPLDHHGRSASHPQTNLRHDGRDIAVVTSRDDQGNFLIRELQRLRARVRHVWPSAEALPSDVDVVYCDYTADLSRRLPWPASEARSALVAILPQNEAFTSEGLEAVTPDAVLARPFTANAIQASLVMAWSQFRYEQRLRSKVDRLEENLRAMRTVERAKAILMMTRALDSEQAYAVIRSQAMARRVPVSSIAAAIVSSSEILGDEPRLPSRSSPV